MKETDYTTNIYSVPITHKANIDSDHLTIKASDPQQAILKANKRLMFDENMPYNHNWYVSGVPNLLYEEEDLRQKKILEIKEQMDKEEEKSLKICIYGTIVLAAFFIFLIALVYLT